MKHPEASSTDAERQEAFLRSIRTQQPILAALYEAGRALVARPGFPARAVLLAHAVRELRNRLPDSFAEPSRGRLDYHRRLEEIRPLWDPVRERLKGPSSMVSDVPVPLDAAQAVSRLIDEDAAVQEKIKARFVQMCAVVSGESLRWSGNARLATQWAKIEVEGIAHSEASADTDARAVNAFETLEGIILRVFEYAPQRERRLKALAAQASTETVVAHLRELVTLHDVDVYFSSLSNPNLFPVLQGAKAFSLAETTLNYWPEGVYLLAVAGSFPDEVGALLRGLGPTTPGITRQLVNITLALPDDAFLKVMNKSQWLGANPAMEFLDPLLKALSRLSDLSASGPLFRIAENLLRVEAVPANHPPFDSERFHAKPVLDTHDFEEKLGEVAALLARVAPIRALTSLKNLLDRVVSIEGYSSYDHYGFWYPNLLDDRSRRYDVKSQVTGALLDLALSIAKSSVDEVIECFDEARENRSLYRRFADAVIARCGMLDQVVDRISDIERWTYGAENRALLERGFDALSNKDRARLIELVYGVQRERVKTFLTEYKRDPSEANDLVNRAVADIFGTAVNATPQPYRSWLVGAASQEHEKPERHPPDVDAMERLGVTAVGPALEEWIPQPSSGVPQPYSIGGHLRVYVEQNASIWLANQAEFEKIPAYFLGWALNGLDGFLRTETQFNPTAVAVARAAVARAKSLSSSSDSLAAESAAHIAQNAGILLVEQAKKATSTAAVQPLLQSATDLHVLQLQQERSAHSPWTALSDGIANPQALAINIIGYLVLSVHNHKMESDGVRSAYDRFSRTNDASQRAALGQFFRWFSTMFPEDAVAWAGSVFLSNNEDGNRAAWAGYVSWGNPNAFTHHLLRDAYRARLNDIAAMPPGEANQPDDLEVVKERTLWHVWVFIANDMERIEDESSLAFQVLTATSDENLAAVLAQVGESLRHEPLSDIDGLPRTFERAMALWERVEALVRGGERPPEILKSIAQWIASPLPAEWRFQKAEALSGNQANVRRDAWVIVQAAVELRAVNLLRALQIVERIVQPPYMEVLNAVQQFARPLLLDGVSTSSDERHIAQKIDSFLVSNHRPSLLDDAT